MEQARFYRSRAAAERVAAEVTQLPHARQRHLAAAETWERMADQVDETAGAKARNEAARRAEQLVEQQVQRRDHPRRSRVGRNAD
jgi:hypothetical protein